VDNVFQTIKVKTFTLMNQEAIPSEARIKLAKVTRITDVKDKERVKLLKEINKLLPPALKEELKALGVSSLVDELPLELSLGSFLFEIIMTGRVAPQAPLKLALFQKQTQELATRLQEDTITVTPEDLQLVKAVLDDDVKWAKVQVNATIKLAKAIRESVTLTPNGVSMFGDILAAAIDIFEGKAPKKKTKVAKKKAIKKAAKKVTKKKVTKKKK